MSREVQRTRIATGTEDGQLARRCSDSTTVSPVVGRPRCWRLEAGLGLRYVSVSVAKLLVSVLRQSETHWDQTVAAERDYVTFGYLPSQIRLSLCVVCNVRAPYSTRWNFSQCFHAICTIATRWHPCKFYEDRLSGTALSGVKRKRSSQI